MNKFKRKNYGLFSLLAICLMFSGVKAEEKMCYYYDYYFFIEINTNSIYQNRIAGGANWDRHHGTYFPALEDKNARVAEEEMRICIRRDENDDVSCSGLPDEQVITLRQFYEVYHDVATSDNIVTFDIPESSSKTTSSRIYEEINGDSIYRFFSHGKWFEIEGSGAIEEGSDGAVDLSDSQIDAMVKASALPHFVQFSSSYTDDYYYMSIRRIINADQNGNADVEPFDIVWHAGESAQSSVLSPALYLRTYKLPCEEKFNAVIDYYYEGTTERVEFDNNEANPWNKKDLEDGYSENVVSPTKKDCTPDKNSVNVKINGADFHDVVYYSCKEVENPKTGTTFIIAASVIGAAAIAGSIIYYYKKVKKKEDNI